MPQHHPGTLAHNSNVDETDVPWALTTHLLSINHDQMFHTTRHPFLDKAAKGTLPKSLVESWLSNDALYLNGYSSLISSLLGQVRQLTQNHTSATSGEEPTIEVRLLKWLEKAEQNGEREARFFQEVAEIYGLTVKGNLSEQEKSEGLRRYEKIFSSIAKQQPNAFIPWLEGAVALWATEKVYFEAWSWSRRQIPPDSKNYDEDLDGGAMRRELIPNWSNRDFMMFVEELERILNLGVSDSVHRDDARWQQVKARTDPIWRAVLDAEEAFWPQM